jgi:hypothetical protein
MLAAPDPNQQPWLIEGLWGGQATGIIGGEPKCGNTFLALDLSVSVASAIPVPAPLPNQPPRMHLTNCHSLGCSFFFVPVSVSWLTLAGRPRSTATSNCSVETRATRIIDWLAIYSAS